MVALDLARLARCARGPQQLLDVGSAGIVRAACQIAFVLLLALSCAFQSSSELVCLPLATTSQPGQTTTTITGRMSTTGGMQSTTSTSTTTASSNTFHALREKWIVASLIDACVAGAMQAGLTACTLTVESSANARDPASK